MSTTSEQPTVNMIKFKSTNTSHDLLELEFDENKTVLQYKQQVGELYDYNCENIKFVFKGKVLNDKEKAGQLGLKNNTVMMVLNKPKQVQKPKPTSSQQAIPKTNLSTGLGSSSPVGFGGYGIMNHPQYMSAISSAVDPQKMQQMLNDPYTESMIEQMMEDPQTLKQLMQQNPMTKQLMEQNPMLKMIMSNPAMMKMVFSNFSIILDKDTIKMAKEIQKNGGTTPQNMQNFSSNPLGGGLAGLGGLGGLNGLGGFGGMDGLSFPGFGLNNNNANTNSSTNSNAVPNSNPFAGMMGNPFFPMMGSGFGSSQGLNFPNNQANPFTSPLLSNSGTNNNNAGSVPQNNFFSLVQTLQNVQQQAADEAKYSGQIKELSSMGFSDKQKCIKFLKESNGDIDQALEKLCLDEDQKEANKQKQQ